MNFDSCTATRMKCLCVCAQKKLVLFCCLDEDSDFFNPFKFVPNSAFISCHRQTLVMRAQLQYGEEEKRHQQIPGISIYSP